MSVSGIMSSQYQRRQLFFGSIVIVVLLIVAIIFVFYHYPDTRWWNLVISFLIAAVASVIFAGVSTLYLSYFFKDPFEIESASALLPQDIKGALEALARGSTGYKIFVRTGRHFRSAILPILIQKAKERRAPIRIEAVLLDFRDEPVCQKYAHYRRASSFDHHLWSLKYVQLEVMATILKLVDAATMSGSFIQVDLYLSNRLSTFRIDGTADEIIVTREDPKDVALRHRRSVPNFSAFENEFAWIKEESIKIDIPTSEEAPINALKGMFGEIAVVENLIGEAVEAKSEGSPYAR